MLSISSALALFVLLIISSIVYFLSKRIKVPYTVLLVLVGILLVPLVQLPALNPILGFLAEVVLTPEWLFYIFLPILIFESAFNMNVRKMVENAWAISLLSVVGLLVSAFLIAGALYFLLPLVGLSVPFIVALLFGSIISSTDPVAVLALFKEFGAPKRLTMIFEGESLFNDGTAVAAFLIILSIAQNGFHGTETLLDGIGVFLMMVILGIIFGLGVAYTFSKGLKYTKSNEFVSITMLIVSAHIVFILCELINANPIFGVHFHISSIIATTVSSLFLGNYARHSLSPRSDEYLNKSVEHLAFIANSLVFLLAGILFGSTRINFSVLLLPIVITIFVVAVSRIISVYAVTKPINYFNLGSKIPESWQMLLAWGSLRGALAIIVVLLIPDDLIVGEWSYIFSIKELLLAMAIGCILATLFIKAITIAPLIQKLDINRPTPFREAYRNDLGIYYLLTEADRIGKQHKRGFIQTDHYNKLIKMVDKKINDALLHKRVSLQVYGQKLAEQTLRYAAINIEEHYLKELYSNDEINETIYRKINGKLSLQREKIEKGKFDEINPSQYSDKNDIFDRMIQFFQNKVVKISLKKMPQQNYQYYRAQSIMSRKVLKVLNHMQTQYKKEVFDKKTYKAVVDVYREYHRANEEKMKNVYEKHKEELGQDIYELSVKALRSSGQKSFNFLEAKGMANEALIHDLEKLYSV